LKTRTLSAALSLLELFSKGAYADLRTAAFEGENLKCLNKKTMAISDMPSSRRFKKNQNQKKIQYSKPHRKNRNKIYIAIGIISVAAVVVAAFLFLDQNALFSAQPSNTSSPSPTSNAPMIPSATAAPLTTPAGEYSASGTRVLLVTSMGNITIQMRDDKPITTQNFVNLVKQGFYDGTIFHRVIAGFMIQGGENQSINVPSIPDEIGNDNRNLPYTIAMAKTSAPNSATSQFFINVVDNGNNVVDSSGTKFDSVYTVFGTVISGQSVVNAIANAQVTTNPNTGENSQPVNPVTITKALIIS
jgi:cyclophilin family peptidyl-prolyl cis-trans isomerase